MRLINRILLLTVTAVAVILGMAAAEPATSHGLLFIALAAAFFASDALGRRA